MDEKELMHGLMKGTFDRGTIIRRIGVARQYLEQVYFTPSRESFGDWAPKAGVQFDDVDVLAELDGPFWDSFARETMYQILENMRVAIGKLPSIGLYVPHKPEPADALGYGEWLRKNVNPNLVMDVHVDDGTVGGCAIAADGMWRDYSVRYFMRKKRVDIINLLTSYVEEEQAVEHAQDEK
jgi:hypothetical protein